MAAIGTTDGICTGRTTFVECLRENPKSFPAHVVVAFCPDAKFFNADQAARKFVDLDPEVKEKLLREFGLSAFPTRFFYCMKLSSR